MEQGETLETDGIAEGLDEKTSPLEPPYYLAGRELQSPFLNAAGLVSGQNRENIIREVDDLIASKVGAIVFGSLTVSANKGLGAYYHDEATGETFNRMRFPNIGVKRAKALTNRLARRAQEEGIPFIVSGAPLVKYKLGTDIDQLVVLAEKLLETDVDFVELDGSCTTLVDDISELGLPLGYNLALMTELFERLEKRVGFTNRLGIKLPSYVTKAARPMGIRVAENLALASETIIPEIGNLFRSRPVFSYVVAANTIANQTPATVVGKDVFRNFSNNSAALSGYSERVKIIARQNLHMWDEELKDDKIDIVRAQAVDGAKEMAYSLRIGAAAVSGVTLFRQSTNWPKMVEEIYEEFTKIVYPEENES